MEPKQENQKRTKANKKEMIRKRQDFIIELDELKERHTTVQNSHDELVMNLNKAIKNKDTASIATTKSQIELLDKELEYMNKREKALTEEIELMARAIKSDDDGLALKWGPIGSWVIGGFSLLLSGWGLYKSHKAFEDGSMIDKGTKSLAEKINPFELFKKFGRK